VVVSFRRWCPFALTIFFSRHVVYRSEHLENRQHPFWNASPPLDLDLFCNGDLDLALKISVFDWEKDGEHRLLGTSVTTTNNLIKQATNRGNADRSKALEIIDDDGKISGIIVILKAQICANT